MTLLYGKTFGELLSQYLGHTISITEAAEVIDVRRATVSNWINKGTKPNRGSRKLLSNLCDMNGKMLLTFEQCVNLLLAAGANEQELERVLGKKSYREYKKCKKEGIPFSGVSRRGTVSEIYPELNSYSRHVQKMIQDYSRGFIGRKYVFSKFDDFRGNHSHGYFPIVGEAGTGKTAIAAMFAKHYCACTYFYSVPRFTESSVGLNFLTAEVIARNGLKDDPLPQKSGPAAELLEGVLFKLDRRRVRSDPLVLVLDALEEAEGDVYLPERLPDGVFFVITHRPGYEVLKGLGSRETFNIGLNLQLDDVRQRLDIAEYIRTQVDNHESIRKFLDDRHLSAAELIDRLIDHSEGNFRYVRCVMRDLIEPVPEFDIWESFRLPSGLDGYYKTRFLSQMEGGRKQTDWNTWDQLYRPAIALLCVAGEPVSVDWLADHLGRSSREIQDRILEPWRSFLHRTEETEQGVLEGNWSVIQTSFREFVAREMDLQEFHARICRFYLDSPERWFCHGDYTLRFLPYHLRSAGMEKSLAELVERPEWYAAQMQVDLTGQSYIRDVKWLLKFAERQVDNGRTERLSDVVAWSVLIASLRESIKPIQLEILEVLVR